MAGKSVTHSEDWWASAPPHVLRCNGQYKTTGLRCRREGLPGTSVCREHGGLSPATRAAAATRIQMTSDEAARSLIEWMGDAKVDIRERVKIAQDLLDRGGLSGAQTVKLMPVTEDPIEALFKSLLNDDEGLLPADAPPTKTYDSELAEILGDVEYDVVKDELRELPPAAASAPARKTSAKPPKHIREGLDLL